MDSRSPRHRGFTTIELLVVLAVLGILAAAVLPLAESVVTAGKERELRAALWEIRHAIDEYRRAVDAGAVTVAASDSRYPASLSVLVQGVMDARDPERLRKLYFLRAIPRDPFADPATPSEKTWRPRSYQSTAEQPVAGLDVYDIRSSSDATALDGTSYASW